MNNFNYDPTTLNADTMECADATSLVEMIATLAMDDADDFYSEI